MRRLAGLGVLLICLCLQGAASAADTLDPELRESVYRVEVAVTDMFGRQETRPVVITVFRPPQAGRYPLLILNHGRAVEAKRHLQGRQRFFRQVRWFVSQGFVVMVPTRIGYGETFGSFDPEYSNACRKAVLAPVNEALFQQIRAVLDFAGTLDFVDASRWVMAGQSIGGYTTVTLARRNLPGLVGAINFSGGYGGSPETRPANPCDPYAWESLLAQPASASAIPVLWLYWQNDQYWGARIPRRWFEAFRAGGGQGEFVQFPAIAGDGHSGFSRAMPEWTPRVAGFLEQLPLVRSPVALKQPSPVPPPSGFARIDDVNALPYLASAGRDAYRNFIQTKPSPRGFALSSDGHWGWSSGYDDAHDRALAFCNKHAKKPCRLYVVDEAVVWAP